MSVRGRVPRAPPRAITPPPPVSRQPAQRLQPYTLDSPEGHFHLSLTLGVPDFERVASDAKEDDFTPSTIKDGYIEEKLAAVKVVSYVVYYLICEGRKRLVDRSHP